MVVTLYGALCAAFILGLRHAFRSQIRAIWADMSPAERDWIIRFDPEAAARWDWSDAA